MIGKKVSHYEIIKKIGEGAKGVIYKARDLKLDRFVALKFLPFNLLSNDEEKKRFIYEAKAASKLDHPNVCTIHEISESEEGQIFISMSFYEGESLDKRIKKGKIPFENVIDIAWHIADGMEEAHKKKIVHRDIKPHNIFLTLDRSVKVLDFGLAKLAGQKGLTSEGIAVGTIEYMSPQQASGERVDHRTDIWSLGVVMYEMLTGLTPFRNDSIQSIIYSIINKEQEPISGSINKIPAELERIINKCLSKDVSDRYQNFRELKSDLDTLRIETGDLPEDFKRKQKNTVRRKFFLKKLAPGAIIFFIIFLLTWLTLFYKKGDLKNGIENSTKKNIQSIAVLPFIDLSSDKKYKYFSDGITDELINALTRISGLHVASRTSSFQFRDEGNDIKKIGEKLNVNKILEGSIRIEGKKIRIIVKLIDVLNGHHIWSEKYERDFKEIFLIQDDITRKIIESLKIKFNDNVNKPVIKRYTTNIDAFKLYLQGRFYWIKRTPDHLFKGMEYFNKAIQLDPDYALAYVGIADTYHLLASYSVIPPNKAFPLAKEAALNALKIDENLSEAHNSLAAVRLFYDWDFIEAEKSFKKAIKLDPNYFRAHKWYAYYLVFTNRMEEAIVSAKRAIEIEPFSMSCKSTLIAILYFAGKYDQVIELYNQVFRKEFNISSFYATSYLGLAYVQKSMYKEAIKILKQAIVLSFGKEPGVLSALGYVYAISGNKKEAEKILEDLLTLSKKRYVSSAYMAIIYTGLGNKDKAFFWFNKAYNERSEWIVYLKVEHIADFLRDDPRFKSLMKKVGYK